MIGIYNISDSDHFFHGSSAKTLEELIDYKNLAVKENDRVKDENMSNKFHPLNLDKRVGKQLLSDPDILRYQLCHVL